MTFLLLHDRMIAPVLLLALVALTVGSSFAGELEDGLLASAAERFDKQGAEIAIRRGAKFNERLKHPDAQSVLKTPVQLVLGALIGNDDPKAPAKAEQILRFLFAKGAKLTGDQDELFPVLAYGHSRLLTLLLEHGANPHQRIYGYLPTELVIKYNQIKLLPILYARNSPVVPDDVAAQIRFVHAASRQNKDAMQLALAVGAKINMPDVAGKLALVQVFSMPLIDPIGYEAARWLIFDAGANANASELGDESTTALHQVIHWNSLKSDNYSVTALVASSLIEKGADVSAVDSLNRTPLHYAANSGNYLAAQVLLKNNAKVSPRDWQGRTPFDLAKSSEVISVLREYGASER